MSGRAWRRAAHLNARDVHGVQVCYANSQYAVLPSMLSPWLFPLDAESRRSPEAAASQDVAEQLPCVGGRPG